MRSIVGPNPATGVQTDENHAFSRAVHKVHNHEIAILIKIHSSLSKPDDALAAVQCQDCWFWINTRDAASKSLFTFLMYLFAPDRDRLQGRSPVAAINDGG